MNIHKAFQNMQSVAGLFKEPTQEIKQNLKARLTQRISSYGFVSREAFDIQTQILLRTRAKVEAHLANGLPSFSVVGLPDPEVRESRERVRAALQNCHFEFPLRRITVNLA